MGRSGSGVDVRERSIRLTFTHQGKQHRPTLYLNGEPMPPTPANVRYAERLAAEVKEKIRLGLFSMAEYFPAAGDTAQVVTLAKQLDMWLDTQRLAVSTKAGYQSAVNFWKAALPDLALRNLRHSHVLAALATRPWLTGKTVNNYVSVLREAVELAVLDGLLQSNPVADVPRAKHQKEPPDPFDATETARIVGAAGERYAGQVHNLIDFWFWTGLRTSELFGLSWENVDLASGYVLVTEAVVRGVHKSTTKTHTARTVKLNSRALAAIQRQRQHTYLAGGRVFHDPRYGTAWIDERAFRRSFWTPLLKQLGIRYRRPYNMRHTYATAMLMAGMTPAFCARQLGHSVEVFLNTYAKWIDGAQNDLEMQRLEAVLSPGYPQETKKAP